MKKTIMIYLIGIFMWWFLGSMLSTKIVTVYNYLDIFRDTYLLENDSIIYSLIIATPFIVSNSIAALLVGIIISLFQYQKNCWRFGLVLIIFGSVPFIFLSYYKDSIMLLVSNILISSLLIFIFSYIGNLIGNHLNKPKTTKTSKTT